MDKAVVRTWDIFCKVIDNYGDIGVCWRLCQQLAARGQLVRLIVDDASSLSWMASSTVRTEFVKVLLWNQTHQIETPADVVIESFGCELPQSYIANMCSKANAGVASHWINLEYLSAEPYAERNHKLPSPVMSGVGKGLTKTFFYPGFTDKTGGLLREPDLFERQTAFNKKIWLQRKGIKWSGERIVSLFCYEPAALPALLDQLRKNNQPTLLLVTAGRASHAVKALQALNRLEAKSDKALRIHHLAHLSQVDYDHLLWVGDFNFVRGEDSLIRAIWAGKPFVWHIYPQEDGAHQAKLAAFLDLYLENIESTTASHIRMAHQLWNEIDDLSPASCIEIDSAAWLAASHAQRGLWARLPDLMDRLLAHIDANRHP